MGEVRGRMKPRSCIACIALWASFGAVAWFWPWLLIWFLGGLVVAIIFGALAGNPVPEVRVDERHFPRGQDVDAWGSQ